MKPQENTQKNNEAKESNALPSHVRTFIELTNTLDALERQDEKDTVAIIRAEEALKLFFGSIPLKDQHDIRLYIERVYAGKTIEDDRKATNSLAAKLLHIPGRLMGMSVEPAGKLTQETLRFVFTVVSLGAKGIGQGIAAPFKKAA